MIESRLPGRCVPQAVIEFTGALRPVAHGNTPEWEAHNHIDMERKMHEDIQGVQIFVALMLARPRYCCPSLAERVALTPIFSGCL